MPETPVSVKKEITEAEENRAGREDTEAGKEIQATAIPEPGEKKEEGLRPPSEEKAGEEEKTTAVEEKPLKAEETTALEEAKVEEEAGYYEATKGDTLSSIAGRKDVYGDPLKWPILFRQNSDALADLVLDEDLPEKEIPEDKKLRFLTPEAIAENLRGRPQNLWVVNIFSGTTKAEVMPQAVKLLKLGYPFYITRADVRGTEWMRLRLGFFATKREADEAGAKIMAPLNLADSWSTKISENEFEAFGGF